MDLFQVPSDMGYTITQRCKSCNMNTVTKSTTAAEDGRYNMMRVRYAILHMLREVVFTIWFIAE